MDFTKELSKFNFMKMDKSFISTQNETNILIESFNATLKRIGKEQNKANMQLEEIRDVLEEENEKQKVMNELRKTLAVSEEEKATLVKGITAVLDQFEDIYRYAVKHEKGNWAEQMSISWENMANALRACGMIRIDEQHVVFNPQRHHAGQVKYEEAYPEGYVLEILRCGYLYNGVILRKAQTVINMKNKDGAEIE